MVKVSADQWCFAGRTFTSLLIVVTGKYKYFEQNAPALVDSGAEIVTVAVRRVNVSDPSAPMLTDYIDPKKITYLPNTAGCFNADDAIRSEEHTSELQSLMRISYAVFCLKKKNKQHIDNKDHNTYSQSEI